MTPFACGTLQGETAPRPGRRPIYPLRDGRTWGRTYGAEPGSGRPLGGPSRGRSSAYGATIGVPVPISLPGAGRSRTSSWGPTLVRQHARRSAAASSAMGRIEQTTSPFFMAEPSRTTRHTWGDSGEKHETNSAFFPRMSRYTRSIIDHLPFHQRDTPNKAPFGEELHGKSPSPAPGGAESTGIRSSRTQWVSGKSM